MAATPPRKRPRDEREDEFIPLGAERGPPPPEAPAAAPAPAGAGAAPPSPPVAWLGSWSPPPRTDAADGAAAPIEAAAAEEENEVEDVPALLRRRESCRVRWEQLGSAAATDDYIDAWIAYEAAVAEESMPPGGVRARVPGRVTPPLAVLPSRHRRRERQQWHWFARCVEEVVARASLPPETPPAPDLEPLRALRDRVAARFLADMGSDPQSVRRPAPTELAYSFVCRRTAHMYSTACAKYAASHGSTSTTTAAAVATAGDGDGAERGTAASHDAEHAGQRTGPQPPAGAWFPALPPMQVAAHVAGLVERAHDRLRSHFPALPPPPFAPLPMAGHDAAPPLPLAVELPVQAEPCETFRGMPIHRR